MHTLKLALWQVSENFNFYQTIWRACNIILMYSKIYASLIFRQYILKLERNLQRKNLLAQFYMVAILY